MYLITTFPSLKIDIEKYTAVKQHLLSFGYDRIKQTGDPGSRKKTTNQWFETQDSISYWEDFYRPKVVWIELADKGRFAVDTINNYLTLNGSFIMTGDNLEYISAVLNNPVTSWHFNTFCISSGVGTNQWRELYVKELFIPKASSEIITKVEQNVKRLQELKRDDIDASVDDNTINHLIYSIIELNQEEIEFIESQ